jgi:hypothetical protein
MHLTPEKNINSDNHQRALTHKATTKENVIAKQYYLQQTAGLWQPKRELII